MAALTWRSVDAPSFYTSIEGTRLAAGLLDRAVSNAQSGLTGFDRAQDEVVGNQLALSASRIQDPTQLRSAMADGTLTAGLDTSRITPAQLLALQTRVGTLQTQNETAYNFDRTQNTNAAMDAAGQAYQDALAASRSGDTAATNRTLDANKALFAALPLEQQRQLSTAIQNQESNFLRDSQGRFNLNKDQRNDADSQAAAAAISVIRSNSPDASSALRNLNSLNLTPGARAMVEQSLAPQYPGMFGPLGSSPGGGAAAAIGGAVGGLAAPGAPATPATPGLLVNKGGAAPGAAGFGTATGSVYDVTYQNKATPSPITSMKLGDLVTHQAGMIKTQGNSPVGAYQINKQTLEDFGPKVLGKDWQSQQFTPEVQDKIGAAIFASTKGDAKALKGRWDGLTPAQAEQVAKLPWDQAKLVIAQAESGAVGTNGTAAPATNGIRNPAEVIARTVSQQLDTAQRNSQNTRIGLGEGLIKNQGSTKTAPEVARELQANFPGVDIGALQVTIQDTARAANVNNAQAGHLVLNSLTTPTKGGLGIPALWRSLTGNSWGESVAVDDNLLKANVEAARSGKAIEEANVNADLGAAQTAISNAQTQYVAAKDALLKLQRAAVENPGYARELPRYEAQLLAAQTLLERAVQAAAARPELQADRGQKDVKVAEKEKPLSKEEQDKRAAAMIKARAEYNKNTSAFGTNRLLF